MTSLSYNNYNNNSSFTGNYIGRIANPSATIKFFDEATSSPLWTISTKSHLSLDYSVITPISINNLLIPGTIFCLNLVTPSDASIKENIEPIDTEISDKLLNLKPSTYSFKKDTKKTPHYGFIAQEVEQELPNLVKEMQDKNYGKIKTVNYLEMIPLLIDKMQKMQKEIDDLKELLKSK